MATDWEAIGQGVGACGVFLTAMWAVVRGQKKSDGKPPEDRPPTPHEIRSAFAELRDRLRRIEKGQDNLTEDCEREFREINRQLDRIENRASVGIQHFTDRTVPPGRS